MSDLESLLERLVRHRFRFVIVGGYAAVAHGSSLVTQDIDVCCPLTQANLRRLYAALADLHPVHRMSPRRPAFVVTSESTRGLKNLYLDTDLGQLDCLGSIKGLGDARHVMRASLSLRLPFGTCRVLTVDALIKAKRAMGRPRDKDTIVQLLEILKKSAAETQPKGGCHDT